MLLEKRSWSCDGAKRLVVTFGLDVEMRSQSKQKVNTLKPPQISLEKLEIPFLYTMTRFEDVVSDCAEEND